MKNFIYSTAILFFFSCSKDTSDEKTSENPKTSQTIVNNTSDCFEKFDENYDELLTRTDIEEFLTIDNSSYQMNSSYRSVHHQWNSDRPELVFNISGQTIKGPDRNRIEIKSLGFYDNSNPNEILEIFDIGYKKLTQEEYQNLLTNLETTYENDTDGFKRAKGFLDARLNSIYEPFIDLGTRAYWKWHDQHGIELIVLAGNTYFTIESKTSDKPEENLKIAKNLAKKIMNKCSTQR